MRILSLITDGLGAYGGIAQYNRDFTFALASAEFVESIRILPRIAESTERTDRVRQDRSIRDRWLYSLNALAAAKHFRPDVIFCGHLYMIPLAFSLSKIFHKPLWLQLHGIEAWARPSATIRNAAERATLVTAVSRCTRRRFLSWAAVAPEAVKVLPNTFDVAREPNIVKEEVKTRYGFGGRKVMLTVSRIDATDRYKGHDKVLRIMPELLRSHPDLVYVIAGDGDGRAALEQLAADLSITANVRFTGRVDRTQLMDYYALSDVFVMPSTKEGFGIVFLEAASFGLPVIGGNSDGSVDALAEGAIGMTLDPGDSDAWVAAIRSVLASSPPQRPPEVGRFARSRFMRHVAALASTLKP